jgi:drug/metabolite transporter (DMT)-like permease
MWLTISIANMLFMTVLRLLQKDFVNHNLTMNPFRINWLVFLSTLPIAIVIVVEHYHTIEHLSFSFWLALAGVVIGFYPTVNYLFFEAIRRNELSNILPILALIPVLTMLSGWLLLNQQPGFLAIVGVLCIAASIYCLQLKNKQSLLKPFSRLLHSKASQAMAVISVITALAAIGDKFAIERSTTSIYFALNSLGAVLVLIISDMLLGRKRGGQVRSELSNLPSREWKILLVLGVTQLFTQISGFAAINAAVNTGYSVAIKNLNIVLASLIALAIYHESISRFKLISYGLSAIGVVMIAL